MFGNAEAAGQSCIGENVKLCGTARIMGGTILRSPSSAVITKTCQCFSLTDGEKAATLLRDESGTLIVATRAGGMTVEDYLKDVTETAEAARIQKVVDALKVKLAA